MTTLDRKAGWKLVPVEPTEEMLGAGWNAMFDDSYNGTQAAMIGAGYDAMLALAPSQPAAVGVTDEMVEAIVQAVRPYTHRTLFLEEHRDLVRTALRSTP